jgi:putative membrane protein
MTPAPDTDGHTFDRTSSNVKNRSGGKFQIELTARDHFAWLRTRLAVERLLMAWLQTGAALIAFGFTIVQFFEWLQSQAPGKGVLIPDAPREFGLALIGAGVLGIVIALWHYRLLNAYLWNSEFRVLAGIAGKPYWTPLFAVSVLLAFVGVAAFAAIWFRLS